MVDTSAFIAHLLADFLHSPRMQVVVIDDETSERYALIHDFLRRRGTPVPANDLWIAASAAQHGLRVLTTDSHFELIPHVLISLVQPSVSVGPPGPRHER